MTETVQPFEADVGRVLDLVVNSLYAHREIFLRELVSNASDACDRLRYLSLAQPELLADDPELRIQVIADPKAGTLTVQDNGIGMGRDELAQNLGTIARSGTARFLEQAKEIGKEADAKLIGQFGVGFYSSFMVAERVAVISRKAGEAVSWRWESDGRSGFSIAETEELAPRGTAVVLQLRGDAKEFLEAPRLRQIVRRYADHIALPILLQVPEGDEPAEAVQINTASALWRRPRGEITEDQYKEFYHHTAHAFDDPYARIHFTVEGRLSYSGLLYVPGSRPFDLYDPVRRHGVKLYVRRVFITDQLEGLLPRYLRFVTGVVDSEDLPLNVSRETLQHNAVIAQMKKGLVRRVLDELARIAGAEDEETRKRHLEFWDAFGAVLKEGLYEDGENRERLLDLARFRSTHGDGWVSLADYLGRMKEGQDAILTISGESLKALRSSPLLEVCRAKGAEVLLLDDAVDEFWLPMVEGYQGKPFRSLSKGEIDLSAIADLEPQGEDAPPPVADAKLGLLIAFLKTRLEGEVQDVRPSRRLTESAVCLVADEHGLDLRLERFLKEHRQLDALAKRVLEINPKHALIRRMAEMAENAAERDTLEELAHLLLDQARIAEGEPLPDPGAFARRLSGVLARAVGG
jgi:molecular chaperone HtpG